MDLQLTEKEGKFTLDTAALEKAIKEGTIEAVRGEIKIALEAEKKAIFDVADGPLWEKEGKSIIDTRFFSKSFGGSRTGDPVLDGKELAMRLASSGGPFLRLSPAMIKFAECVRLGFDPNKLILKGINIQDYNKEIVDWNKKDTAAGLTTTDVGALVPIEFLATVIEFATAQSMILPKLWRIPMGSLSMRIPTLAQAAGSYFGGIVLYHPEEAVLKDKTKPEFSYKTFTAKKLIGLIPMSDEVVMDSAINLINYITGLFVRAFQYTTEGEVVAGTGLNGQMLGILSDPGINLVSRQVVGTVRRDDVINLESALDENFQDLTYLIRRLTLNTLRKEKTATGVPVYYESTVDGLGRPAPGQLNGYPFIKSRNIPALGVQGDITLGDLSYYIWALRQDMTIDMSKERYFEYDQTALRFVMRQDGAPGVSIAFAALDNVPES